MFLTLFHIVRVGWAIERNSNLAEMQKKTANFTKTSIFVKFSTVGLVRSIVTCKLIERLIGCSAVSNIQPGLPVSEESLLDILIGVKGIVDIVVKKSNRFDVRFNNSYNKYA